MSVLIDQLLLLVSVAALAAAGWRAAGATMAQGLVRIVAATALAALSACGCALGLGLVSLGSSPVALTGAAGALWGASRVRWPKRSGPDAASQLKRWWGELSPTERIARGALVALLAAYGAWIVRHPGLGYDALADHLALPVNWIHNGRPGSVVAVNAGLPFALFPNTHELLVTWVSALSRTFVAQTLLTPLALVLLGASVRAGLARARTPAGVSWLAVGVACTFPLAIAQLPGPNTDLPGIAWLAASAALALTAVAARGGEEYPESAAGRAGLFVCALVAAGLAAGTKTPTIPLLLLVLGLAGWRVRRVLRRHLRLLVVGLALAIVAGGWWYLRDLLEHGSPLWPLSSGIAGDPVPPELRKIYPSFLDHIAQSLHRRTDLYWHALAGGLVVVFGALTAPVWARSRQAAGGAAVVAAGALIWAASPYSGNWQSTEVALGATRYLLPCLLSATVIIALSARRARGAAIGALTAALAVNLDRSLSLGYPTEPTVVRLLAPALAGALLVAGTERWRGKRRALPHRGPVIAAAAVLALLGLTLPADGYLAAHAGTGLFDSGLVRWFDTRAAFAQGRQPIIIGPVDVAILTGARLSHPLSALGPVGNCEAPLRAARRGWVVLELVPSAAAAVDGWRRCLSGLRPAHQQDGFAVYAPPALSAPR